jgi:hypothetical protein
MNDKFNSQYARLFGDDRRLKKVTCAKAIQESAWWVSHPAGPVRAPRHCERLVDGHYGYEISFGAHAFCVERSILKILESLRTIASLTFDPADAVVTKSLSDAAFKISRALNESVANQYNTLLFSYPMSVHQGRRFLLFGAQGIEADDFYQFLFRWLGIEQLQSSLVMKTTW